MPALQGTTLQDLALSTHGQVYKSNHHLSECST